MKYLRVEQLAQLVNNRLSGNIPKSVMDYWYMMYGTEEQVDTEKEKQQDE